MGGPTSSSRLRKAGHRGRSDSKARNGTDQLASPRESSQTADNVTLRATLDAGLKPGLLTLQGEKRKHSGDRARYMKVRDYVLTAWGKERR